MKRYNWQYYADRMDETARLQASIAEDAFERVMLARTRKTAAKWLRIAERAALKADAAAAEYGVALRKLRDQERRRERYEREQRQKRGPVKLYYGERPATEIVIQPEYEDFGDEEYPEWEFGFEYDAAGGALSNVDVNFRVRRDDGKPFNAKEAARVMHYARVHRGQMPVGYRLYGIDWRSPHGRRTNWKSSSDVSDVRDNLISVIDAIANQPQAWRLGAPKD